jgi:hypothetical protein
MKNWIAIFILLLSLNATAAPFFRSDVLPGVTNCGVFLDSAPKVIVGAVSGVCAYDLAGITVGTHSGTMTAMIIDPVMGTFESQQATAIPIIKPAPPAVPTGAVLVNVGGIAYVQFSVAAGVTNCGVFMDATPKVTVAVSSGVCRSALTSLSNGSHSVTMSAINADPNWGTQESAPSPPFVFSKPAAPIAPSNLRVAP